MFSYTLLVFRSHDDAGTKLVISTPDATDHDDLMQAALLLGGASAIAVRIVAAHLNGDTIWTEPANLTKVMVEMACVKAGEVW